MANRTNRRWVLASRPEAEPTDENFRFETAEAPSPGDGQILVRNLWLSVDPYMRGRMSDRASYARPVKVEEVMVGGTVGEVVESRSPRFLPGEIVVGYGGWQDYSVLPGEASGANQPLRVESGPGSLPISTALSVAGMPGATAYFGLFKLGEPKSGETLVVSAAAGAVGTVVGQLGKMVGCRVVGVAGGANKCSFCVDELGFDACVDYKAGPPLGEALRAACPSGVDIYFENVGGAVLEAVAPLLNRGARVPICGMISQYNLTEPVWPGELLARLSEPPASRFFLVWEWPDEYPAAITQLVTWVKEGKLKYRHDVVAGLENAPRAFAGLFQGGNIGKRLVEVASERAV